MDLDAKLKLPLLEIIRKQIKVYGQSTPEKKQKNGGYA